MANTIAQRTAILNAKQLIDDIDPNSRDAQTLAVEVMTSLLRTLGAGIVADSVAWLRLRSSFWSWT